MKPAVDMLGREFKIGDKVARAVNVSNSTSEVQISEVTAIGATGKIRLDGSTSAIWYPDRMLIVNEVFDVGATGGS